MPASMLLVDLTRPGMIAPYDGSGYATLLAGFIAAAVVFAMLTAAAPEPRRDSLLALPVLGLFLAGYVGLDVLDRRWTAAAVAANRLKVAEGCVRYFHTGAMHVGRDKRPDEQWEVAGHEFAYRQAQETPGYHAILAKGGVVRPGERLRVSYLVSPVLRRKEIYRIEALPGGCPAA